MPKKIVKPASEAPPACATCLKPADGSLYVRYEPYDEQALPPHNRYEPSRMDRGISIHMPVCTACMRSRVTFGMKLELESEKNVWAHLDPKSDQ